ncbi:Reverse transcriptase (RNA-dependent DNA polymerase) [Pseudobacteriovorax antillogorgiicola]|uniref:Reverse transcriptase (RNA-dependent DNA polymerase) n=2 Tax=Pseudobacteriovorax antillogorgiicola TaxID=1513793 RepID=A0A1Y6CWL2_9BACT|nr:reverse transcriptase (RNA-dependent DNA polymerase) [Pseudobacteriovorax antillogorgiicola]SMF82092.1 Reverse transcriptase (RNA-dependent DNA polymerase) [Pseudobacteriovorax antillogorgiicola]
MHYCFDYWMKRNFSTIEWCRYADDGLAHCKTEAQALYLLDKIRERFTECGIELHEDKTKIVYCRDQLRTGKAENYEFDFLGFRFRTRQARNLKDNRRFNTFSPAPSPIALKQIRHVIKYRWRLQSWIHYSLDDIARAFNPMIQGWINYYSKFNRSYFVPIIKYINDRLRIWFQKKFPKLRGKKGRTIKLIQRIIKAKPRLFAHWRWIPMY